MENNKVNIYFANNDYSNSYDLLLSKIFPNKEINIVKNWKNTKINLIIFTGGEDIDPSNYGENKGKFTHVNLKRDQKEFDLFHSIYYGTPKLGICRGAQFLTVASGGKLIQHVEGHNGCVDNITILADQESLSGEKLTYEISVPSDHHQMMFPYSLKKDKYEILGFSTYFKSSVYLNGDNENIELPENFLEPEIVYYPSYNSLAIQSHPEWIKEYDINLQIIVSIIKKKLLKN